MHEISQCFFFDAAHTLQRETEAAGSRRIHGHTYNAEVTVAGLPDPATGMVTDLGRLRARIADVRECLDHHLLDEVEGLGAPTLENLCTYIARSLDDFRPKVVAVRVWRQALGDACKLTLP